MTSSRYTAIPERMKEICNITQETTYIYVTYVTTGYLQIFTSRTYSLRECNACQSVHMEQG